MSNFVNLIGNMANIVQLHSYVKPKKDKKTHKILNEIKKEVFKVNQVDFLTKKITEHLDETIRSNPAEIEKIAAMIILKNEMEKTKHHIEKEFRDIEKMMELYEITKEPKYLVKIKYEMKDIEDLMKDIKDDNNKKILHDKFIMYKQKFDNVYKNIQTESKSRF